MRGGSSIILAPALVLVGDSQAQDERHVARTIYEFIALNLGLEHDSPLYGELAPAMGVHLGTSGPYVTSASATATGRGTRSAARTPPAPLFACARQALGLAAPGVRRMTTWVTAGDGLNSPQS